MAQEKSLREIYDNLLSFGLNVNELYKGVNNLEDRPGFSIFFNEHGGLFTLHDIIAKEKGKTHILEIEGETEILVKTKDNKEVLITNWKDAEKYIENDGYLDYLAEHGEIDIRKIPHFSYNGKALKSVHFIQAIAEVMGQPVPKIGEIKEFKHINL